MSEPPSVCKQWKMNAPRRKNSIIEFLIKTIIRFFRLQNHHQFNSNAVFELVEFVETSSLEMFLSEYFQLGSP